MTKELEEWDKKTASLYNDRRPQYTNDERWGYYAGQQADEAKSGVRLVRTEIGLIYDKIAMLETELSLARRENAELRKFLQLPANPTMSKAEVDALVLG